jgi:GMP synthase (glutamine-hydrolysing)
MAAMALHLLVVEGNTRTAHERHRAALGYTPSEGYAAVLERLAPDAVCDICFPADEGANLPDGAGLEGYDGVVLTGSSLHLWDMQPEAMRQVELARAVYRSRTAFFGSCWGIQVASVAAGGSVARNPAGRELAIARNIAPTAAGRDHPLLAGRPAAYDAPCVHLDIVDALPPDCTVLASNRIAPVQAAEIRHDGGRFWGVQYHPEFSLTHVAKLLAMNVDVLVADGFFSDHAASAAMLGDWELIEREPTRADLAWRYGLGPDVIDAAIRTTEIANWLEHRVRPEASARGRA